MKQTNKENLIKSLRIMWTAVIVLNLSFFTSMMTDYRPVSADTPDSRQIIYGSTDRECTSCQDAKQETDTARESWTQGDSEAASDDVREDENPSLETEHDYGKTGGEVWVETYKDKCDSCGGMENPEGGECERCDECEKCSACEMPDKECPDKEEYPEEKKPDKKMKINGRKYLGSGQKTLSGWEIALEDKDSGKIIMTDTTDAEGYYEFSGLTGGTYLVYEKDKPGWGLIKPEAGSYTIDLDDFSKENYSYDFRNLPGIGGKKIDKSTGNKLAGWTIYLQVKDNSDWKTVEQDVTDSDGSYFFAKLEPGEYRLKEETRQGWEPVGSDSIVVELDDEPLYADFYNKPVSGGGGGGGVPKSSIKIKKFEDRDGSATTTEDRQLTEIAWTFTVARQGGSTTTKTTVGGIAEFNDLLPGIYTVTEEAKPGWTRLIPENGSYEIVLKHAETEFLNFVNHKPDVKGEEGEPVLEIEKTIGLGTVQQGTRNVPYRIIVRNTGTLTAFDVVVTDILPGGLTHTDNNTAIRTWEVGDLEPDDEIELNFTVNVNPSAEPKNYINTAEAVAANHGKVSDTAELRVVRAEGVLPVTGLTPAEMAGMFGLFLGISGAGAWLRKNKIDA